MEQVLDNPQNAVENNNTSETPVTETQKETTVSKIGKFENAEALLTAYNALQSEFTKRCQKLKEVETNLLQANAKNAEMTAIANTPSTSDLTKQLADSEFVEKHVLSNKAITTKVIENYLKNLYNSKSDMLNTLGTKKGNAVLTPVVAPKTLAEAKRLADSIFNI